jgi:hypothetical protein
MNEKQNEPVCHIFSSNNSHVFAHSYYNISDIVITFETCEDFFVDDPIRHPASMVTVMSRTICNTI